LVLLLGRESSIRGWYTRRAGPVPSRGAVAAVEDDLRVLADAHQQPSLTRKKLRRLELTAGAPKHANTARGVWSGNVAIRQAERQLAQQAELSYRRMVKDQQAGAPARKVGASATPERA
jgi:hypothetical protein